MMFPLLFGPGENHCSLGEVLATKNNTAPRLQRGGAQPGGAGGGTVRAPHRGGDSIRRDGHGSPEPLTPQLRSR